MLYVILWLELELTSPKSRCHLAFILYSYGVKEINDYVYHKKNNE